MQNQKSKSKALVVFIILAFALFVAWAALFVTSNLAFKDVNLGKALSYRTVVLTTSFVAVFTGSASVVEMIEIIASVAIPVIFIVVDIVVAAKKKSGAPIASIFASLLLAAALLYEITAMHRFGWLEKAIANGKITEYVPTIFAVTSGDAPIAWKIFFYAIVVFFALFVIASIVLFVGGLVVAGKKQANVEAVATADVIPDQIPAVENEETIEYESLDAEPLSPFVPEPEPEEEVELEPEVQPAMVAAAPEAPVEQPAPEAQPLTKDSLADMLRDIVRDMVRDEMNRNKPTAETQSITGATFGGPLVVQYFNGGINSAAPAPAPVVEEPKPAEEPAPVVEEEKPAEEPAPVAEEPAPAPVAEEPAPVAEPVAPVEEVKKEPIIRIPFTTRLLEADKDLKANYNEIKNEILSWGVHSRVSNTGDTFRLHRKTYIKLVVAGKGLKLYFALDPENYKDSTIPVLDASEKGLYTEIPLVFKVKSGLSVRRCKELIKDCMEADGLVQKEVGNIDWVKEVKALVKEQKNK